MILVVDDDPGFLATAEEVLAPHRGVYLARNASGARDLMRTVGANLSLVLIDLDLPDEDGFSLIREMRRNFPDIPVIAISGVVKPDVLASALAIGAVDALRKPITPQWSGAIARARSNVT